MNLEGDFISAAVKMFISLGIVLIILICIWFWVKKFTATGIMSGGNAKHIKILSSCMIGTHKGIYLVEIADFILVIGVTNNSITLLDKISDSERIKAFVGDNHERIKEGFASQLAKIIGR